MTSDACREVRPLLGAGALGDIAPEEAIALRAHLDGCAECRAEMEELRAVANALPLADPSRIASERPEPSGELAGRVLDRVARERDELRARRRRRAVVAVASALVAAAAVIALVFALSSSTPAGTRIDFKAAGAVHARATLHERPGGTQVAFHVGGLQPGEYYWLWLTGDDGDRVAAGTFQGTPAPIDMTLTAAIPLHDTRRIWVTDAKNNVVLDHPVPSS